MVAYLALVSAVTTVMHFAWRFLALVFLPLFLIPGLRGTKIPPIIIGLANAYLFASILAPVTRWFADKSDYPWLYALISSTLVFTAAALNVAKWENEDTDEEREALKATQGVSMLALPIFWLVYAVPTLAIPKVADWSADVAYWAFRLPYIGWLFQGIAILGGVYMLVISAVMLVGGGLAALFSRKSEPEYSPEMQALVDDVIEEHESEQPALKPMTPA